jgi:hypothetical protein
LKKIFILAAMVALAGAALAADVGVSVSIGQPGFYGRIVLGNMPQPQVIYTSPVIIQQVPVGVVRQPIYLHVPPGHEKHWDKHCRRYKACGQPVYFVQNNWYQDVYAPNYRQEHGDTRDHEDRGGRRDRHDGDDNGRGHGQWKKDKGHGKD